jgi:hypothetical protein
MRVGGGEVWRNWGGKIEEDMMVRCLMLFNVLTSGDVNFGEVAK